MSHWFEAQTRCLNRALSQHLGAAGRLKPIEPVGVFAGVQDAHEHPYHYLVADDGQELFTDTSKVFANDRHVRVALRECERVKVNKYGEKCRRAGAFFQPLVLEALLGGMPKTTAKIFKKRSMLPGHRMGSDPMFLHRRWLQKLTIKVQVLNENLVATCAPYGDAYVFGVCLVRTRRELCVRWQAIGQKDEEAVLCANCVTSYPVPRSTRRTGVFIDFRESDASSAYSASRRETGEASFVLRVELTKAMHAVR
jgi:hypothetical protein